jgi:hypothetical protein
VIAGAEDGGAGAGVDHAGDTELPCDDRAVAQGAADVDHQGGGDEHGGGPAGIGGGADEDLAGFDVGDSVGTEDYPGRAFGDAGGDAEAFDDSAGRVGSAR